MIAWLGMYDPAPLHAANDALWRLIRNALRDHAVAAPEALTRDGADPWKIWRAPDLVLAQTCGLPFRMGLHSATAYVGTPDYGLPGCASGWYYSELLVRAEDPRAEASAFDGAPFAYNGPDSNSGWALPRDWAMEHGLSLKPALQTGSHAAAAQAVAEGRADIMGIDAHTHRVLHEGGLMPEGLRVLARTDAAPGLPLITAQGRDAEVTRHAVAQAIAALPEPHRAALHLRGLSSLRASDYLPQG